MPEFPQDDEFLCETSKLVVFSLIKLKAPSLLCDSNMRMYAYFMLYFGAYVLCLAIFACLPHSQTFSSFASTRLLLRTPSTATTPESEHSSQVFSSFFIFSFIFVGVFFFAAFLLTSRQRRGKKIRKIDSHSEVS